ncbi:calcium/sodium antiporter [Candidatus Galacturonibacter soehngenii]|uniref:Calcium/sodium antiporter n=1 Tax=Candidatus Galacturonatibacter soehngenii TaxID=2307010 RepID=A0A7V7UF50_9FIRM|nr:calcium/sodium antiporter [Candidatus Galacturonibacter soehngenii]KAB1435869.1 calcium/sodium antiporter [Candidatus Galacturonibacter soehngenii]MBA4686613.1 calcium/sodium antiporter [Candidatus Galacturonibacter soehngenii]
MLTYFLLIIGFVLLVKGADFFVDGSSSVAKLLKVPSLIIGLTVVAFGTSMPEASVSITAALAGKNELAISNVIGSNVFNLLVVVGASAIISPLTVQISILKKEFPYSILITALLLVFSLDSWVRGGGDNQLSRLDGSILFMFFILFVASTVRSALSSRKELQICDIPENEPKVLSPIVSILYIVLGLAAIIWGGNLVVNSATQIALSFHLSETLIGLTIVAIGTSLPELVTSVVAAKKGESDIALGNVVGSNIFNILLILGTSATIKPIVVTTDSIYDLIILIFTSLLVYAFAIKNKRISRIEGILMVLLYIAFTYYIIVR